MELRNLRTKKGDRQKHKEETDEKTKFSALYIQSLEYMHIFYQISINVNCEKIELIHQFHV